jgi:hypothetical protein
MQLYKLASMSLASNTLGMLTVGLMVNPPKEGEESYALYVQERDAILSSMKRRAQVMSRALNAMTGVTCNEIEGAMYAFPTITLPRKFISAAVIRPLTLPSLPPSFPRSRKSHRSCTSCWSSSRHFLLLEIGRRGWYLHRSWFRIWSKGWHLSFQNHYSPT